jgi:hypothetical protein
MSEVWNTTDHKRMRKEITRLGESKLTFGVKRNGVFTPFLNHGEKLTQKGQRLYITLPRERDQTASRRMVTLVGGDIRTMRWINELYFRTTTGRVESVKEHVARKYGIRWAS